MAERAAFPGPSPAQGYPMSAVLEEVETEAGGGPEVEAGVRDERGSSRTQDDLAQSASGYGARAADEDSDPERTPPCSPRSLSTTEPADTSEAPGAAVEAHAAGAASRQRCAKMIRETFESTASRKSTGQDGC